MHGVKHIAVRCVVKQPLMGLCSHPQPPLVQTQTVTITAVSNSSAPGISTTEVPLVQTKSFIYDSSKVGAPGPAQPRSVSALSLPCLEEISAGLGGQARGSTISMRQHCTFPGSGSPYLKNSYSVNLSFLPQETVGTDEEKDGSTMTTSQTVTSETSSGTTVTTTHISKVSNTIFLSVGYLRQA